jgi:hypothetical protein
MGLIDVSQSRVDGLYGSLSLLEGVHVNGYHYVLAERVHSDASIRTATPLVNPANWCHSTAHGEFASQFLNGVQRSFNRKVQGSNPCSGANVMSQDIVDSFFNLFG